MCDCAEQIHGRLIVRKIQDDRSDFVWTFGKRAQCLLLGRGVHEFTPATGRGMLNRQVALGIVDSNDKEGFHVARLRREEIPRLGIDWHSLCRICATAERAFRQSWPVRLRNARFAHYLATHGERGARPSCQLSGMNLIRAAVTRTLRRSALVFSMLLISGCASFEGATGHLTPTEKMVWSTYAIGTQKGLATCVVVNRSGNFFPVLITSAHVLSVAPHGPFFIAARVPGEDGNTSVALLEFQPSASAEPAYVRHPDYDVAAIEVPIPPEIAAQLALPSFINEKAIGARADAPRVGEDVSVLGFPQVFPGTTGAFPVLRAGRIASYSVGRQREWGKFLINTSVYPGDSGAPVFAARRRGRPHLIGMVSERIGPRGGAVPLAVAIDARVIRETLQLLNAKEATVASVTTAKSNLRTRPHAKASVRLLGAPSNWMPNASAHTRGAPHR